MATIAALLASIEALEAVQRQLGEASRRDDDKRWHEVVQGRRALSKALQLVIDEGETLLRAVGDAALLGEFRQRLSQMRAKVSWLQASWPVIRARDEGGADYLAAVAEVRRSDKEYIDRMRQMLNELDRAGRR